MHWTLSLLGRAPHLHECLEGKYDEKGVVQPLEDPEEHSMRQQRRCGWYGGG